MKYYCVRWLHAICAEPIIIYTEVDESLWERRKVEVYSDGRIGFASEAQSFHGSMLSIEPLPSIEVIAKDPQFEPEEIDQAEFETVWNQAKSQAFS